MRYFLFLLIFFILSCSKDEKLSCCEEQWRLEFRNFEQDELGSTIVYSASSFDTDYQEAIDDCNNFGNYSGEGVNLTYWDDREIIYPATASGFYSRLIPISSGITFGKSAKDLGYNELKLYNSPSTNGHFAGLGVNCGLENYQIPNGLLADDQANFLCQSAYLNKCLGRENLRVQACNSYNALMQATWVGSGPYPRCSYCD